MQWKPRAEDEVLSRVSVDLCFCTEVCLCPGDLGSLLVMGSVWVVRLRWMDSLDETSSSGVGSHGKVVDLGEISNFAVET